MRGPNGDAGLGEGNNFRLIFVVLSSDTETNDVWFSKNLFSCTAYDLCVCFVMQN